MSQQLSLFPTLFTAFLGWGQSLQFTSRQAMVEGLLEYNKRAVIEAVDPNPRYDFAYVDSGGHTVARVVEGL